MQRVSGVVGIGVVAVLALGACSSGGTPAPSPSPSVPTDFTATTPAPTSPAPTASAEPFKVKVGDWELELSNATAAPEAWPSDIPAPAEGVVQATGTGEPIKTASDHPVMAVEYMAPGGVAAVTQAQVAAMEAQGWKPAGPEDGITVFIKGNNSARIAVKANASTGGVTVYQWI